MFRVFSRSGSGRIGAVARVAVLTAALAGAVLVTAPAASAAAPTAEAAALAQARATGKPVEVKALSGAGRTVVAKPDGVFQLTVNATANAVVSSARPSLPQYNWTGSAGIGYTPTGALRQFHQFDTAQIVGKHVVHATVATLETWAPTCGPRPVDLWETGPISPATTWSEQPAWLQFADSRNVSHGSPICWSGGDVNFDATQSVADAAASDQPTLTFGLKAQDEGDRLGAKQFDASVQLVVSYTS
jgi:hypothetical protein